MSFEESHSPIPDNVKNLIDSKEAFPILVSQASIYPNGRMMPVIMKGIPPEQSIINMEGNNTDKVNPTKMLANQDEIEIPVLIGSGMAKKAQLKEGDTFTIRWLDSEKTYDAMEGTVIHIMNTENFKLDIGTIWIPIKTAQSMLEMKNEATYVTYNKNIEQLKNSGDWLHRDVNYLISDIEAAIEADKPGNQILFMILLSLTAMGIFNAQVLSIFRRGREIGTLMALGMTRSRVVGLFTLEGALNSFLATAMTVIVFGPILWYFGEKGIPLPMNYSEMGLMIAKRLIPVYSVGLILTTTILIAIIVLLVSYLPSRKISKMKPTDALRGKITA
jgi:ABC-type lipoprotein release transport system permease subunit